MLKRNIKNITTVVIKCRKVIPAITPHLKQASRDAVNANPGKNTNRARSPAFNLYTFVNWDAR